MCDSCPSVDTIVLIAGLFRALVEREVEALRAGVPAVEVSPPLGRAALWRAARSGLEGELVDVDGPGSRPAGDVVTDLVRSLRPQLEAAGDWEMVSELARQVLIAGTSAARQRRALRRRGRLTDVVDQLIAETAGRWPNAAAAVGRRPDAAVRLPAGQRVRPRERGRADQLRRSDRSDRPPSAALREDPPRRCRSGVAALRSREGGIEQEQRADNITFRVTGQSRAQLFPVDLMPRVVGADEWAEPDGRVWGSGRERSTPSCGTSTPSRRSSPTA